MMPRPLPAKPQAVGARAIGARAVATPGRRGACPALDAPMRTGDGLLLRLSPETGGLSPNQLIALCESAARNGNGMVEVTARGSLQFRGFDPASAGRFAEDVGAAGIAVRTGVSVDVGPLAGLDPSELADPRPLADAIRAGIGAAGLQGRLGPKVSVVVDGGGMVSLDMVAADVRLTAERGNDGAVWRLAIGGDAAGALYLGHYDAGTAVEAALTFLEQIARLGRDARARDLISKTQLVALCPTRHRWTFLLHNHRVALRITLPFGSVAADALIRLARTAHAHGISDIRPAPMRCLLAICPDAASAESLRSITADFGFITADDVRSSIAACPGGPACASGHIAARQIAEAVASLLADDAAALPSIHISGCAKGCARPAAAALTVVGVESGAALVVDGTSRAKPLAYRPGDGLAAAVAAAADAYRETPTGAKGLSDASLTRIAAAFRERHR